MELFLVCAVIFVALVFTYTNGFHDTANSIATVVGTKVLTPRQAILLATVTNLLGAMVGAAVAKTIASGLVDARVVPAESASLMLIGALLGAILWNLITWYVGLPSSSSHALIGGGLGSAIAAPGPHVGHWAGAGDNGPVAPPAGLDVVNWHGLVDKVLVPSLLAPFFGIVLAAAIMLALLWIIRRRH